MFTLSWKAVAPLAPPLARIYISMTSNGKCWRGGGGGASLIEANGDVPLDGVAFSIEFLE